MIFEAFVVKLCIRYSSGLEKIYFSKTRKGKKSDVIIESASHMYKKNFHICVINYDWS